MDEQLNQRIQELEEKIRNLENYIETTSNDSEMKKRQDMFKIERIEENLGSQSIHSNLGGLNADDHGHYLNESRHGNLASNNHVTTNEKNAIKGTEGTPSNTNRFVTNDDERLAKKQYVETLPSPTEELRGVFYFITGGVGVADTLHVCAKTSDDTFVMKEITLI